METVWALGLAEQADGSGILASLLFTDGRKVGAARPSLAFPYPVSLRENLEELRQSAKNLSKAEGTQGRAPSLEIAAQAHTAKKLSQEVMNWFLQIARTLIDKTKIVPSVVGFSGLHNSLGETDVPQEIAEALSSRIRCPVVSDFQKDDQEHGGTGRFIGAAYFQTLVHQFMKRGLFHDEKQVAILTINDEATALILSADSPPVGRIVGPGFHLIDEFTQRVFQTLDIDGRIAGRGDLDSALIQKWLKEVPTEGACPPPEAFRPYVEYCLKNLVPLDGVTTLVAFSTQFIERRMKIYPNVRTVLLFGRATQNFFMQSLLSRKFAIVLPRDIDWNTDFLEAETCAFLAVRRLHELSISYPTTTGVEKPIPVGRLTSFNRA